MRQMPGLLSPFPGSDSPEPTCLAAHRLHRSQLPKGMRHSPPRFARGLAAVVDRDVADELLLHPFRRVGQRPANREPRERRAHRPHHRVVLAARAKGVSRSRAVLHHALRNSLIVVVTIVGLQLGVLISGAVVTEQIFAWPGVGWLMIQSINQRDYAVVQGAVLVVATGFVIVNLLTDLLYARVDPRVAYD